VEIAVRWPQGPDPRSDWTIQQDGWVIEVADRPTVTMTVGFLPFPDFEATTLEEFKVLGHVMTATHRRRRRPGHRHLQRRAADPAARRRGTHLTGPTGTATMRLKARHTDSLVPKHCRHAAHIYRYLR
jgi:hypothetical protein